jgi:hemoglobin-like flavoprotein
MRPQEMIRKSFEVCIKRRMDFAVLFYKDFFRRHPEIQPLFRGSTSKQEKMLTEFLISVVDKLDDEPWLNAIMYDLGVRHAGYQITPEMFEWFWESLTKTLCRITDKLWTQEMESLWRKTFEALRDWMLEGYQSAKSQS